MQEDMIEIISFDNEVEATLTEQILIENNIPYYLRKFNDMALDGIYQMKYGYGILESFKENREEIINIYNSILEDKKTAPPEDEITEDAVIREAAGKSSGITKFFKIFILIILVGLIFGFVSIKCWMFNLVNR